MIFQWLLDIQERYAAWIAVVLALLLALLLFVSQFVESVEQWVLDRQIVPFVVAFLLVDSLALLAKISRSVLKAREADVRISRDQAADDEHCRALIKRFRPKRADLLEFSGGESKSIIYELKRVKCKMRILLVHPGTVGESQRGKIISQLDSFEQTFDRYPDAKISIRCYSQPYSIRGRKLGNKSVNVGWYTPDLRNPRLEVCGHSNPLVTASLDTDEGKYLARMFDGLFNRLWKHPTTVPAREAYWDVTRRSIKLC